jgi:hypothetical protein
MPPIAPFDSEPVALFETVTVETWLVVVKAAGTAELLLRALKALAVVELVVGFVDGLEVIPVAVVLTVKTGPPPPVVVWAPIVSVVRGSAGPSEDWEARVAPPTPVLVAWVAPVVAAGVP